MSRLARLTIVACLVSVLSAAAASAAPHMWIGFHDDPSFRWRTDRMQNLAEASKTNATIVRAFVYWPQVAPTRPANPADPFDPGYRLNDLDELVRSAQEHGQEVLFTVYGTPTWANGGKSPNYAPRNLADFGTFTRAVASRYSGRYPGYPFVRFWSIWNEPNLNQFLAPQFTGKKDTGPAIYAKLFRVAYAGIKKGAPGAQVAIGETSARGRDKPLGSSSTQDSHSPGRFAQLLSQQKPLLRFDAWSHHPYPTSRTAPVTQMVKWPNVSLTSLPRFETSIDSWFHRKNTPVWLTEYAYESKPAEPNGVSASQQAANARAALQYAARDQRVAMFIWFTFRDDAGNPRKSGVVSNSGGRKPSFATFASTAKPLDGRNLSLTVRAGRKPVVNVPVREFAAHDPVGSPIGITYKVFDRGKLVTVAQPQLGLGRDAWVSVPLSFTPLKGHVYVVKVTAGDTNGASVDRTLTLTAS